MVSCGMVGAQCSSHGSLMALSCLMEGAKGQVLGHQNKATTFSSTPSLFFTLPLNIIAAKNHTLATFNIRTCYVCASCTLIATGEVEGAAAQALQLGSP